MRVEETLITLLYLFVCIGIGLWARKKVKESTGDYWVAGRGVGIFANSWAMMAALASGGSVIGVMGLAYDMGIPYAYSMYAGAAAGFPMAASLVAKQLRDLELYTITDFLEFRYKNKAIEIIMPIIVVLAMGAYIVAQMAAAGYAAVYLLGIPFHLAVIITAIIFILYVSIGGMWAITYTDMIQGIIMVAMVILLAVILFTEFGGMGTIITRGVEANPNLGLIADVPLSSYVGAFVVWFIAASITPHLVMRVFTAKGSKEAKLSLNWAVVIYGIMIVFGVWAVASAGHIVSPGLENPDEVFLTLVESYMPTAIAGVTVAAVMAAVMSTTDALLLSVSSALTHDLYAKFINPNATEKTQVKIGIISTWVIGLIAMVFALDPPHLITLLYTAAIGLTGSTFFAPTVLGIWWKRATTQGALWGIIAGAVSYLYLFGFTDMPALSHILVSLPLSFVVHIVVSLLTEPAERDKEVIKRLEEVH